MDLGFEPEPSDSAAHALLWIWGLRASLRHLHFHSCKESCFRWPLAGRQEGKGGGKEVMVPLPDDSCSSVAGSRLP